MSKQMICPKAKECKENQGSGHCILHNEEMGCYDTEESDCPACVEVEPQQEAKEPFKRYAKYEVMKLDDIEQYLTQNQKDVLGDIIHTIQSGRRNAGKIPCNSYVVVKEGLPYTEKVWQLIEEYETQTTKPSQVQCPECGHPKHDGDCRAIVDYGEHYCACKVKPTPTLREQMPLIEIMAEAIRFICKKNGECSFNNCGNCKACAFIGIDFTRLESAVKAEWNKRLEEIAEDRAGLVEALIKMTEEARLKKERNHGICATCNMDIEDLLSRIRTLGGR